MFMNRSILYVGSVVAIALVTVTVRGQIGSSSNWKEFTIVRNEGSHTRVEIARVTFDAQRRDGSRSTGDYTPFSSTPAPMTPGYQGGGEGRFVVLRLEGRRVSVDDRAHVTTTLFMTPNSSGPGTPDQMCGFTQIGPAFKPAYLGTDKILGFKAIVSQTEQGPFLTKVWKVPDLDCSVLRMSEDRRDAEGKVNGHFESVAVSVTLGAPDPRLFTIPADYVELSPAQRDGASRQARGIVGGPPDQASKSIQDNETRYHENHERFGR